MPTIIRRTRKRETPVETKTRLILARRKSAKNLEKFYADFKRSLSTRVKGGEINITTTADLTKGEVDYHVNLGFQGTNIASANVALRLDNGRLTAYIFDLQDIKGHKNELSAFEQKNGTPWNMVLGQRVLDAAYKAKADRIGLIDIRHSNWYKEPFFDWRQRLAGYDRKKYELRKKGLQKILRRLYDNTADKLGLRKKEGKYWILDFP